MSLSGVAILLVDQDGKIMFMNDAGRRILDAVPGLRTEDLTWKGPQPPLGEVVEVGGESNIGPIRLMKTWLSNGREGVGYAALCLERTRLTETEAMARLVDKYRLTPAELRLAMALLSGHRPESAAQELGVTIHTVRTYLKRLYRKAGVRSQSTLVCAMNRALA